MRRLIAASLAGFSMGAFAGANNTEVGALVGIISPEVDGADVTAVGAGIFGTYSVDEVIYIGGSIQTQFAIYDLENTDNYIDSTITGFTVGAGAEFPVSEVVLASVEITGSTSSSQSTYHYAGGTSEIDTDPVSGMSIAGGLIADFSPNELRLGISKGITGDYSDNDASFIVGARHTRFDDLFFGVSGSFSPDSTSLTFQIGSNL